MSFWSGLAKIAAPIAGIAAAPFTGGTSLIPTLLSAGGAAAGGIASGMASNRGTQGAFDLQANDQFERALMAREANKRADRSSNLRDAVASSALSGFKPAQRPAGMPNGFAGGLGPVAQSALSFEGGDALSRLKAGDQLPALQRAQMPKAGFWEKLLNVAGPVAGAMGQVGSAMQDEGNGSSGPSGPLQGSYGSPMINGAGQFSYGLQAPLASRQTTPFYSLLNG